MNNKAACAHRLLAFREPWDFESAVFLSSGKQLVCKEQAVVMLNAILSELDYSLIIIVFVCDQSQVHDGAECPRSNVHLIQFVHKECDVLSVVLVVSEPVPAHKVGGGQSTDGSCVQHFTFVVPWSCFGVQRAAQYFSQSPRTSGCQSQLEAR